MTIKVPSGTISRKHDYRNLGHSYKSTALSASFAVRMPQAIGSPSEDWYLVLELLSALVWSFSLAPIDLNVANGDSRATWSMLNSGSCASLTTCRGEADCKLMTARSLGMSQSLLQGRMTTLYALMFTRKRCASGPTLVAKILVLLSSLKCDKSLLVVF